VRRGGQASAGGQSRDAGEKYRIARDKISGLWHRDLLPSVSVQVLQEFYVNLIRKKTGVPVARETVSNYLEWDVIDNDRFLFVEALRWKEKWNLSYWDALILAAAAKAKAREVWSEDLISGHDYDGIVVVNPLIPSGNKKSRRRHPAAPDPGSRYRREELRREHCTPDRIHERCRRGNRSAG
jgi:predicted nucleic acid-binding protein